MGLVTTKTPGFDQLLYSTNNQLMMDHPKKKRPLIPIISALLSLFSLLNICSTARNAKI